MGLIVASALLNMGGGSSALAATPQLLVHVNTDLDAKTRVLYLLLDDNGDLAGINYIDTTQNLTFTPDQILSGNGAVLMHDDDHNVDVVRLKGDSIDLKVGGTAHLDYLVNGLTGSRGEFDLELHRITTTGDNQWAAYTSANDGHSQFTSLFMHVNKVFFKAVGIESIEPQDSDTWTLADYE